MTTSCEKNTLHALDVAAAIDEHREELFAKRYLTQARRPDACGTTTNGEKRVPSDQNSKFRICKGWGEEPEERG
jgi:tRNA A37 threonylcarbamoyladenosine modification protein TsaB